MFTHGLFSLFLPFSVADDERPFISHTYHQELISRKHSTLLLPLDESDIILNVIPKVTDNKMFHAWIYLWNASC